MPANEQLYGNPGLGGVQATGGSTAIRTAWQPLRQAGAIARTMIVGAAAKRWNVDAASCRAQNGTVVHEPTGKTLGYGELVEDAARMPMPESVTLKGPDGYKLIGTPAKRLDTAVQGRRNGCVSASMPGRPASRSRRLPSRPFSAVA